MSSSLGLLAAKTANLTGTSATAAPPAWRQFPFFDAAPVKDVHDLSSTPDIFKATPEISTVTASSVGIIVADIHGSIYLLNREFESVNSWVAHVGGRVTHMVERKGILVTLGEEDNIRSPLLKIWDLQNKDKKTSVPNLLRSTKVQLNNRPHPVTTVALSDTVAHLAIGLGDGTVILYRHLDQSLASSTSLTSLPKARTVHESPTEPITGLGFREPTEDDELPNHYLFIVTTNRTLCYQASGRGTGGTATVVDEIGSGLGCATMDRKSRNIVVARDEAIYLCGADGRGACYAYEGHKSSIHTHESYLVIVSPPFFPTAASTSATVRNLVAKSPNATEMDVTKVTVFDPENKLVAYSDTFKQGVREVISQWGHVYVLSTDGKLVCLEEKSTAAKLDMLYRKSLYGLALNMASTQKLDPSSVADIHRQYGDYLYGKSDYDGAMHQYVQTIGHLQPSYVIRKYLDAQRIHNLVTYLQELHSLGLANADHTTLLLNTYTKLKDVSRLDTFIKTESRRNSSDPDELPFDLVTAIRVCRQAGYFEHASYLAKKYERHEDYLRIQIEDAGNFSDALAYLRKLGPEAAESNLARYGRAMLESLPEETTQLLIDLCTTTGPLVPDETAESPSAVKTAAPAPSYLSYLALNRGSIAATVVSSDTATPPSPSIKTVRADNASRRDSVHDVSSPITPPPGTASSIVTRGLPPQPAIPEPPPVKRLSPRIYFPHFVDHMEQFVVFLETVSIRRWNQSVEDQKPGSIGLFSSDVDEAEQREEDDLIDRMDQVAVWNTLLELYLTLPIRGGSGKSGKTFDEKVMRDKAMRVLRSSTIPYDSMHALILCSTYGFTDGLVLLWEKMGMYEDVLRFWMDKDKEGNTPNASQKVIEHLMYYGKDHPHLYPLVLRFLTSTPELLSRHQQDLKDILEHIDEEELMPPLGVIQVLSRNGVASVGLVKEWLVKRIKDSRNEIQNDQALTKSYRLETAARLKQVQDLTNTEEPRVFHVTRCSTCLGQLDLPSVHFMCNHSYHQRCIAENEAECPACAREHGVIREIRLNNEKLADQHDVFLSEVQENGFEAVASAYGRGVLNGPRLEGVA
ncbi:hypothetical protein GALMADRAFT_251620 [Galerina marginata CBS 339.88]|uniref:E3 ubiquitin-protein ligase PEP5 n=1 Tax=Galerina marginata (strain CBS 339.88) TaxID=685588 RepID=A0A067T1H7_GALM3|nr:hypothetical protein GALMADRAFT_251620 [Galerina marginata CBS 339.88]